MRKIIRLKFTTPLHISNVRSDYGVSETIIHSDTMYSAIIEAWNSIGLTEFIPKSTNYNLPFTISSLFPFTKDNKNNFIYFLPRPASFNPNVPIDLHKEVKKIEYIEAEYFKKLQEGEYKDIDITTDIINLNLLTNKKISTPIIFRSEVPRVKVPRSSGDSQPFYVERIYFKENSGLYFFLEYENENVFEAIKSALNYLKNEGIGTDRNVGNGKFEYEIDDNADIVYFSSIESEYSLNLSLFIPPDHETIKSSIDDNSYFSFITRGGWITTFPYLTLRKKYVRAIKEGSVLKIKSGVSGRIVDITPDKNVLPEQLKNIHPIFRIGKSFWVPYKQ